MDQEQWQKVNAIVDTALDLEGKEQTIYIDEQCGNDKELKRKVTELLESIENSETENFLEGSAPYPKHLAADLARKEEETQESSLVGETIDSYRILELIGHGGMASVFLAERADEVYEGKVALKLMRQGMDTPSNKARFKRERNILANLEHPHIARLRDGGVTDKGLPYLVMEYVEGTPLYVHCDEHTLTIEQRLDLFKSICEAVQYAHKNAVIHRDLKPANILVKEDGTVKVLDFGIAKLLEPEDPDQTLFQTRTGARMLTLGYAAPEQIINDPITTATDIYSLGVVLYELLAATSPFDMDEKNLSEIESLIRTKTPRKPSTKYSELSQPERNKAASQRAANTNTISNKLKGDLDAIVMKTLRKDPEARYNSVDQLLQDLNRLHNNLPLIARKDTVRYKTSKFINRHKTGISVTAAFVLMIIGFIGFHTWQITEERNQAQLEAEKAKETSQFLVSLFSASNPSETLGDTIRVRTILERGLKQINQLQAQPEVQSQMLQTMGNVYRNLGEYDKAEKLLTRSLKIQTKIFGEQSAKVASVYNDLGGLHQKAQEIQKAEPNYKKALKIRKSVLGTEHLKYAETLSDLGALMRLKNNLDSAQTLYNKALSIRRNKLNSNHPDVANSLNNLGVLQKAKGHFQKSQEYYQEALKIRRNHLGKNHPKVANVMNNLAVLYRTMGKFDLAEQYYAQTLDIRKQVYGQNHPLTAQSLNNFAGFLVDQGNYDQAETYYRQALQVRKNFLGPSHIQTGTAYNNLANALFEKSQLDSAGQAYRNAINIYASSLGEKHRYVGIVKSNLAKTLTAKNELEAAEKTFDKALTIMRNSYDSENLSFANLYSYRAKLELKRNNISQAKSLLEDALEIRKELQGTEHPEFKKNINQLTSVYRQLGHKSRADSLSKAYSAQ